MSVYLTNHVCKTSLLKTYQIEVCNIPLYLRDIRLYVHVSTTIKKECYYQ